MRDFQTTRLNSTAGTGVASILASEAALLNPASSAFFQGNSFSYQASSPKLKDQSPNRVSQNNKFSSRAQSQGLFVSDYSGPVKGGLAYLRQVENKFEREKFVLHGASASNKETAIGASYGYERLKEPVSSSNRHQINHFLNIGVTHIVAQRTILGLVVKDALKTVTDGQAVKAGIQQGLSDNILLLADVGFQGKKSFSKTYEWNTALQLTLFDDFFLRAGLSYDELHQYRSKGWGFAWMGPKLGLEFAQRFSTALAKNTYLYENERIIDTSLSAFVSF